MNDDMPSNVTCQFSRDQALIGCGQVGEAGLIWIVCELNLPRRVAVKSGQGKQLHTEIEAAIPVAGLRGGIDGGFGEAITGDLG